MTARVGQRPPQVELERIGARGLEAVRLEKLLAGRCVALVGRAGFTSSARGGACRT